MHPDDKWACESIIQYAEQLAEVHRYDPKAAEFSPFGSFVCTGSPVSNAWSRAFLEYSYINQANPALGLRRSENPTLILPFAFELSREVIRGAAKQIRHKAQSGRSVLNWSIRTRSGHFLCPNTQNMDSDFLLISRIPNWKEPRSHYKDFKNSVTIFAGTHGVGTSAVRLLFSNIDLLKSVLLKNSRYEYWQVLLTINKMESAAHPHSKNKRLIAKSINLNFECEPVNV
jgi:hypothetical protein